MFTQGHFRAWCTLSFTGLTFQIESSTSSVYSCTEASTAKLLGTWWTTVHQFLTSFSASVCVRPAVTNCPYHATSSEHTADERFLLLVRLSGTHWIQSVVLTVTDSHWRHFYFCITSVFSVLEVVNALYKFTFDIWLSCHWLLQKLPNPDTENVTLGSGKWWWAIIRFQQSIPRQTQTLVTCMLRTNAQLVLNHQVLCTSHMTTWQ